MSSSSEDLDNISRPVKSTLRRKPSVNKQQVLSPQLSRTLSRLESYHEMKIKEDQKKEKTTDCVICFVKIPKDFFMKRSNSLSSLPSSMKEDSESGGSVYF